MTPTTLRELRSLRLRLDEMDKRDKEAVAALRRACETRLELVESLLKLQEPLIACMTELGYPPIVVGATVTAAGFVQHETRRRLDKLEPLSLSSLIKEMARKEREIEKELEQWR